MNNEEPPCWICRRKESEHVDADYSEDGCCNRTDLKNEDNGPIADSHYEEYCNTVIDEK